MDDLEIAQDQIENEIMIQKQQKEKEETEENEKMEIKNDQYEDELKNIKVDGIDFSKAIMIANLPSRVRLI